MTVRISKRQILFLLHHDTPLFEQLCEAELLPGGVEEFDPMHAETARVVGTLIHDLDVNWSGVEVILRMRSELLATQRQMHELLNLLRSMNMGQDR